MLKVLLFTFRCQQLSSEEQRYYSKSERQGEPWIHITQQGHYQYCQAVSALNIAFSHSPLFYFFLQKIAIRRVSKLPLTGLHVTTETAQTWFQFVAYGVALRTTKMFCPTSTIFVEFVTFASMWATISTKGHIERSHSFSSDMEMPEI